MPVIIDEVVSRVRAVDGKASLAPETVRTLVELALAAMREEKAHDERVKNERSINNGYLDKQEQNGGGS